MSRETYLIGITGPSGAGKTYLSAHLATILDARVLALDRYYRDLSHLSPEQRARMNFDAPEALDQELIVEQVTDLRNNQAVQLPIYDFATHTRTRRTEELRPSAVVIVEGLFTLHWPKLRELLGTKVFVDMNDEVCLTRRQARDVRERGRTPESVVEQYAATVAPMAQRYVRPTIVHADVVVSGSEPIGEGAARVLAHYRSQIANAHHYADQAPR
ncbi:MAG: uridine kinase [Candidatus Korobacteraceae bacterium]